MDHLTNVFVLRFKTIFTLIQVFDHFKKDGKDFYDFYWLE